MTFLIRKTFLLTRGIIVNYDGFMQMENLPTMLKNDDIYKPTKVSPRDIVTLKTHVMCHFEKRVNLRNDNNWQEKKNY